MRYNFYYILNLLGKLPGDVKMKLRNYIKVDNLHYEFAPYETNLTAILCQRFPNTVETKLKQTRASVTKHQSKYNNSTRNMKMDIQNQDHFKRSQSGARKSK